MHQDITRTGLEKHDAKLGDLKHHVFMFKLHNKKESIFRAFCGGSIITKMRVLTSSHCFLTNRKRYRHTLSTLRVVGGKLATWAHYPTVHEAQQWRYIDKIYSQKFLRFPAYNLAIVQITEPWTFNQFVNKIPYASKDYNFDGVCSVTAVRSAKSWSYKKFLYSESYEMLTRFECESILLRNCKLYYSTAYDIKNLLLKSVESEGSGLICKGTGDPKEVDRSQGILVGVTSMIHTYLPTLHHKVGPFHKWVTDSCDPTETSNFFIAASYIVYMLLNF